MQREMGVLEGECFADGNFYFPDHRVDIFFKSRDMFTPYLAKVDQTSLIRQFEDYPVNSELGRQSVAAGQIEFFLYLLDNLRNTPDFDRTLSKMTSLFKEHLPKGEPACFVQQEGDKFRVNAFFEGAQTSEVLVSCNEKMEIRSVKQHFKLTDGCALEFEASGNCKRYVLKFASSHSEIAFEERPGRPIVLTTAAENIGPRYRAIDKYIGDNLKAVRNSELHISEEGGQTTTYTANIILEMGSCLAAVFVTTNYPNGHTIRKYTVEIPDEDFAAPLSEIVEKLSFHEDWTRMWINRSKNGVDSQLYKSFNPTTGELWALTTKFPDGQKRSKIGRSENN